MEPINLNDVTLCMAFYENAGMLAYQYAALRSLPPELKAHLRVIIVDDGTAVPMPGKVPARPAWVEDIGIPLAIYAMDVDVRWNQDACRNLAVAQAETKWVLLTDIDHIVPAAAWQRIVAGPLLEKAVYRFARKAGADLSPRNPHPNSWLLTRDTFDTAGGYDERFAGYYGTVGDFRKRLQKVAKIKVLPEFLHEVTPDMVADCRTTRYQRKTLEDKLNILRIAVLRAVQPDRAPIRGRFPWHRVM